MRINAFEPRISPPEPLELRGSPVGSLCRSSDCSSGDGEEACRPSRPAETKGDLYLSCQPRLCLCPRRSSDDGHRATSQSIAKRPPSSNRGKRGKNRVFFVQFNLENYLSWEKGVYGILKGTSGSSESSVWQILKLRFCLSNPFLNIGQKMTYFLHWFLTLKCCRTNFAHTAFTRSRHPLHESATNFPLRLVLFEIELKPN